VVDVKLRIALVALPLATLSCGSASASSARHPGPVAVARSVGVYGQGSTRTFVELHPGTYRVDWSESGPGGFTVTFDGETPPLVDSTMPPSGSKTVTVGQTGMYSIAVEADKATWSINFTRPA
jgi:hypothetical protein